MVSPLATFSFSPEALLPFEHHLAPARFGPVVIFTDTCIKDFHPTFLIGRSVGVEVDNFTIVEANTEPFFDKHITFLFLREARSATLATLSGGFFLCESTAIIDEL